MRAHAIALVAVLLVSGAIVLAARPAFAAPLPAYVRVLFDLGDGTYAWRSVSVPDPNAANATWDATLAAASSLGLWVSWSWNPTYGVFIMDIGNRSPPAGGVGIFLWNASASRWDTTLGISALVLKNGDALALSDNAFDPVTYNTLTPVPTPDHPYPAGEFRGDAANTGNSPSPAPEGVGLRWDHDLHLREIPSSPAVAYGRAYILTLDGLFALNESTGAEVWSAPAIQGLSTPAVFNGTLILGGRDGKVHAIDAATGHEAWNVSLIAHPVFSGITSSPKILFDTAYVGTFNETGGPGEVVSLWATNGTVRWRHAAPGSVSFSSPAIVGGALYVGVIGLYNTTTQITYDPPYGLLALDAATGARRWFAPSGGSVAASPVVVGSRVIAPAKDGNVYAWNATDGTLVWKTAASAGVSSPAVHGDSLFVAGGSFGAGGRVVSLTPGTGAVKWTATLDGPVQSSVTYADGEIFFSTNTAQGRVYALDAATGQTVWAYTPLPPQYIFGSPSVADGLVFAPSDNGHVYAVGPPASLLDLRVSAPSSVGTAGPGTVTLRVTSSNGTARNVWMNVTLLGLDLVSSDPAPTAEIGVDVDWYLGSMSMGSNRTVTLVVRENASAVPIDVGCIQATCTERVSLLYSGFRGTPFPAQSTTFRVQLQPMSTSPSGVDWIPVTVGVVVVAGVAAAAVLLLRRRRSRHGP